jgi:hypothetical protein
VAGEVAVSPEGLRKAAGANVSVQATLSGIMTTLQDKVAARGKPWGDDSYGSQFDGGPNGYDQVSKATTTNAKSLSDTFGQAAQTLGDAAKGFDGTDTVSSTSFDV